MSQAAEGGIEPGAVPAQEGGVDIGVVAREAVAEIAFGVGVACGGDADRC